MCPDAPILSVLWLAADEHNAAVPYLLLMCYQLRLQFVARAVSLLVRSDKALRIS